MRRLTITRLAAPVLATVVAIGVAFAVPAIAAAGAPPFAVQQAALYAADPQAEAHFGNAVAVSGDTIVVGESDRDVAFPGALATSLGTVHVFVKSGPSWVLQQELTPPLQTDAFFGVSVAIDGDVLVVGAPAYATGDGKTGAAFVYRRTGTTWSAPTILVGETVAAGAWYGESVAINGDTIVVGAPGDDGHGTVWPYVWTGIEWLTQGTLSDPAWAADDALGGSVAVRGDDIIAGASGDDYSGLHDAGSLHWFTRSGGTWTHRQRIVPPDPTNDSSFGGPLAMSEGRFIVGSMSKTVDGLSDAGCAYTFYNTGDAWLYEQTLTAPTPTAQDYYGSGVALDGRTAIVGAFWADSYHGAAFFYERAAGTWSMRQKVDMTAYDPSVAQMGSSAALSGGTAVIGAQMSNSASVTLPGAAFVFTTRGTVSGVVRDAVTGLPVAGIEVSAYVPDAYDEPELVTYTNTDALGRYSLSLDTGDYRIGWMDGTEAYYPGFYNEVDLWSGSSPVSVVATATTTVDLTIHAKPVVYLSKPLSPSAVRRLSRFTVSGYLKPRHRAGTYPVKIQCYLYQRQRTGGYGWVLVKTMSARAYDYRPNRRRAWYTKYRTTFSLPARGKWRIRAYHPADATYGPTYTDYRYITVK
jgi:hypothetical protein